MPFCPNSGTESEATQQFCRHCGAALAATVAGRQTVGPASIPATGVRVLPYYLSPTRILVMTVLTYGLYLFYWRYLTWKQYRDHTGQEVFPVWHALTLFVPIYNLFRTHAHIRTYKELMVNSGVASTLSPGWAVGLVAISVVLDGVSFNVSGGFFWPPRDKSGHCFGGRVARWSVHCGGSGSAAPGAGKSKPLLGQHAGGDVWWNTL